MSPQPGTSDLESLAQTLADGFQALLKEVDILSRREQDLDARLKIASQEYAKLASNSTLECRIPAEQEIASQRVVRRDDQSKTVSEDSLPLHVPTYLEQDDKVREGFQAFKMIKSKNLSARPSLARSPLLRRTARPTDLEQDFTTPGIEGSLECPFSRVARPPNGVPTPPQDNDDPMKAEFHRDLISHSSVDAPPSTAGAAGKCPIRYLDQHSPEEVAKYFENHKHEIPRSHEICVKRYQKNSDSIRELDSKYGNIVSMIQGLGVKHKQYLPGKDGEIGVERGPSSAGMVEKWADEVSHRSEHLGADITSGPVSEEEDEEVRTGHFQRPLREIRVGESPSRPWGISVPIVPDHDDSAAAIPQDVKVSRSLPPVEPVKADRMAETSTPNCPFGHGKGEDMRQASNETGEVFPEKIASPQPQMIFNGPVFFGYPADQMTMMMQAVSGSGSTKK